MLYAIIIEDISKQKRQNSGWSHSPQVNALVRASLEASKQVTKDIIPIFYHAFWRKPLLIKNRLYTTKIWL